MYSIEQYNNIFKNTFDFEKNNENIEDIKDWDSVDHVRIITEIEDSFDIMLETEDILELTSYQKGIEILKKYNIEF